MVFLLFLFFFSFEAGFPKETQTSKSRSPKLIFLLPTATMLFYAGDIEPSTGKLGKHQLCYVPQRNSQLS